LAVTRHHRIDLGIVNNHKFYTMMSDIANYLLASGPYVPERESPNDIICNLLARVSMTPAFAELEERHKQVYAKIHHPIEIN
jgi:hypothetical protein